ncbi:MAG: polymer-forming cytoskeletal protein, partial [Candidatus Eremiobacteraeota bacterium]|nr:polymer-forming cytoskeletal protein [Candidatus Eremiobacteraeota bacterium]
TASADITGKVSSSGTDANAVNLGTYSPLKGTETSAATRSMPDVDILGRIAAKTSAPAPTISAGTTTLTGGPDLYYPGDLTINGDLKLQGVKLYVDGKLTVNGSITGEGSLYVAGETNFQGDARVSASSPDKVALFSNGSVTLTGFDGTAYMNSITGDATLTSAWNQLGASMNDFKTELAGSPVLAQAGNLDLMRAEIGGLSPGTPPPVRPGRMRDAAGVLVTRLAAQPPSSARDKMMAKLGELSDLFKSYTNGSPQELNALANLAANRLVDGAFDAAIDNGRYDLVDLMLAYSDAIDYNSLGTSYFQGLVFTHGGMYASNEVTVRGAVVALDNGSQGPMTVGTDTINPGDIYLTTGTRLTYVEDFFKPDNGTGGGSGAGVLLWMGR